MQKGRLGGLFGHLTKTSRKLKEVLKMVFGFLMLLTRKMRAKTRVTKRSKSDLLAQRTRSRVTSSPNLTAMHQQRMLLKWLESGGSVLWVSRTHRAKNQMAIMMIVKSLKGCNKYHM